MEKANTLASAGGFAERTRTRMGAADAENHEANGREKAMSDSKLSIPAGRVEVICKNERDGIVKALPYPEKADITVGDLSWHWGVERRLVESIITQRFDRVKLSDLLGIAIMTDTVLKVEFVPLATEYERLKGKYHEN